MLQIYVYTIYTTNMHSLRIIQTVYVNSFSAKLKIVVLGDYFHIQYRKIF